VNKIAAMERGENPATVTGGESLTPRRHLLVPAHHQDAHRP